VPKPDRPALVRTLLKDPARRPAILYAPSRKDAEALAGTLAAAGPNANASWFIEGKGVLPKSALTPVAR